MCAIYIHLLFRLTHYFLQLVGFSTNAKNTGNAQGPMCWALWGKFLFLLQFLF